VLQEVWLQALKGIHSLRDPGRLPVWLYAVARNRAMSHHRDGFAREKSLGDADLVEAPADEGFSSFDDAESVHHGLSLVGRADREVLTLFFLRDLSIAGVAEVLGIPPGTVKSRLFKAKNALRIVLQREGNDHV
jgi:RNA polymerase sigma factor (sigma-70 family)